MGQGPPPGAVAISKESLRSAGGPDSGADQGVKVAVVVFGPQVAGVRRAARAPSKTCSSRSEKGTCGFSAKVVESRPVTGSGVTLPANLATMPVSGSEIAM